MATADQKRKDVYDAYSTDSWHRRVRKMSDSQILAIWFRLKKTNKI